VVRDVRLHHASRMSATIRTLRADEREAVLALLDAWPLQDGWRGRDFFRRYVETDPTYADQNFWVAEQDGALVSCVQTFPRLLRMRGTAVPVGGIGSVFTAEKARDTGVASALLEAAADAMRARGMELSLLFAARHAFYGRLGWHLWPRSRGIWVRGRRGPDPARRIEPFDAGRDLDAVIALHERQSAALDGTVVRDRTYWRAQLGFAGNPLEDFVVARDAAGRVVAYARGFVQQGLYMASELCRAEGADAAAALADLVLHAMQPRDPDPLAARVSRGSGELRRVVIAPTADDPELEAALDARCVERKGFEEKGAMLRVVAPDAFERRVGVPRRAGESDADWLARVVPPERFSFWPADRF
jgi:GNAT superfamily N-acetyltransferase